MTLRHSIAQSLQILSLVCATRAVCAQALPMEPYRNPRLGDVARARDLVSRMTLKEKVGQMVNDAPAIPRLGIPAYNWWSEGLHGVARSGYATLFPQAIGLAATWDAGLMKSVGGVVGTEARAKYNDAIAHGTHSIFFGLTIWAPNINILRDPRWGRGQETYGEDPFLTAHLAVPFIRGLQGDNPRYALTIATPKHFAVHSGPESARHREDVHPSVRDLFDTYLPAFRAAIVNGHAESLMCAYNAVSGEPACGNSFLLKKTLRDTWGFQGFVTSDCGAIEDFFRSGAHNFSPDAEHAAAAAVLAGTDTNCGSTYEALVGAVQHGLLKESDLDVSLLRLFTARMNLGMFDGRFTPYGTVPMSEVGSAAHLALATRAARESLVLLTNRANTLPLSQTTKRILVVGPNAASLSSLEGNYNAIPRNPVLPLDGVRAAFPQSTIGYAQGSGFADGTALPVPRTALQTNAGEPGLRAEYFSSVDFSGTPVVTRIDPQLDFDWTAAAPVAGSSSEQFSVRWTGTIQPPRAGDYSFSIGFPECYPCNDREVFRVYVDGTLVAFSEPPQPVAERPTESAPFVVHFADTRPLPLRIEYSHTSAHFGAGLRLDWFSPTDALRVEAVQAAQSSDAIVAFVGLSPLLEGEEMPVTVKGFAGGDKTDLELPAIQRQLLEDLKATGKPLIVVLMNGSALNLTWVAEHADAVLEAWYPGEGGGTAIGETLSGQNNPSGRLPMTFYRSVQDLPPFDDYAMAGRTYRYYRGDPLFGFGFGLSYTHFSYKDTRATKTLRAGEPLTVTATVTNDGACDGEEVVELYIIPPQTELNPQRFLAGTQRVRLRRGEHREVTFTIRPRTLSLVDGDGNRAVRSGIYRVYVGGSQPLKEADGIGFSVSGTFPVAR